MFKSCSPYLKLFSDKGVKWYYSLDKELLNRVQEEDKLIFLHIGYISNITARESSFNLFSNKHVISTLNENFISIIEDKEDKPESYLLALDLLFLNQDFSYGPINVFITPNRKPIIAFSNSDPENFLEIVNSLLLAKKEKREKLYLMSEELSKRAINTGVITEKENGSNIDKKLLEKYLEIWFDNMFESDILYRLTPFTPNPYNILVILEYIKSYPNELYESRVENLLDHLQFSAIFDVIDGGFFSQATDFSCSKPLFEKTLEENSQFLLVYAMAYDMFRKESYRETALKTYEFIINELSNENYGLINSTTLISKYEDAVYYSYSINELSIIFPERYMQVATSLELDLTQNRMSRQLPSRGLNTYYFISVDDLRLLRERRREHRGLYKDIRSISASNLLAVSSMCKASEYLSDTEIAQKAVDIFEYIVYKNIDKSNGRLYRYTCCSDSYLFGYLSDYAYLIEASLELYKKRGNKEFLHVAKRYTDIVIEKFYKSENGMFSKSERDVISDTVPFKRESNIDVVKPSANSIMAGNLISLFDLSYNHKYLDIVRQQIFNIAPNLLNSGPMLSSWAQKILKYIKIDYDQLSE